MWSGRVCEGDYTTQLVYDCRTGTDADIWRSSYTDRSEGVNNMRNIWHALQTSLSDVQNKKSGIPRWK